MYLLKIKDERGNFQKKVTGIKTSIYKHFLKKSRKQVNLNDTAAEEINVTTTTAKPTLDDEVRDGTVFHLFYKCG